MTYFRHKHLYFNILQISPATCEIFICVNGEGVDGDWKTHKNQTDVYSHIWISFC